MGVQCQILINQLKEGVLKAGQRVTGKIKIVVEEPTEYMLFCLRFVGKEKCVFKQDSKGKSRICRSSSEHFQRMLLYLYNDGTMTTLQDNYEHAFDFSMPITEYIPRSYKDHIASISYIMELEFQDCNYDSSYVAVEIPVYGYLDKPSSEGPVIFGLEKELFAPFASKTPYIHLKAEINKTMLAPGENAYISYEVTNDTNVDITSVKTELYCYTTYTAGRKYLYLEEKIESCEDETPSVPKREVGYFMCVLPTLPNLYSDDSIVFRREYRVRSTVLLPVPHLNATVEQPVLIEEAKSEHDLDNFGLLNIAEQPSTHAHWLPLTEVKEESDDYYDVLSN